MTIESWALGRQGRFPFCGAGPRLPVVAMAIAVGISVAACGAGGTGPGDDDVPDASIGPPVQALFEVPRGANPPPSGFYALPFPNDVRVGADGRIAFADYHVPDGNGLIQLYIDTFAEKQRGFSVSAAAFFRFGGELDPESLPQSPELSLEDSASVYLVNIEPQSARRGERTPLRFRFEPRAGETIGANWLAVLPYPGFILEERARHAVVVTRRARGAGGATLEAAPDFAAIAGESAPADADLARAQAVYQPLWDWLDEPGGDERADVVSAAVFTTQDATSAIGRVREFVFTLPEPAPRNLAIVDSTANLELIDGLYDAPNFQSGLVPYLINGGDIQFDPDTGDPIVQRMEEMRVSFSVPTAAAPPGGWPILIFAHGTGGSYHSFYSGGTAERLAAEGIASVGIDQVLHGPRNPGASPEISFFNFQNPLAARDNSRQGAIDNIQLLRLILAFDEQVGGRQISFDPDRIYFMGHSQGSTTGPPWLAHEPLVRGAVLSGAGALIYLSLLYKTEPLDIPTIVGSFIRDMPLDEFNPVLALIQMWLDPADPASYGPLLVQRPLPGIAPKPIFQSEGFDDSFTPNISIEAFATSMGVDQVEPIIERVEGLALRQSPVLTAPVSDNQNGVTAALLQYPQGGSDGHFVVFTVPAAITQHIQFISTLSATGTATIVAP